MCYFSAPLRREAGDSGISGPGRPEFAPGAGTRMIRAYRFASECVRRRNSEQTIPVAIATFSDSEPRRPAGQGGMKSFG